jgi:hypothetical protein
MATDSEILGRSALSGGRDDGRRWIKGNATDGLITESPYFSRI